MRVFNHIFPNHTLAIACLDCVDPDTTYPVGSQYHGTPDSIMTLAQHLEPLGIVRILMSLGVPPSDIIAHLPENVRWNYMQNVLKPKYFATRNAEVYSWPTSAQEAKDSGNLGDLPFLVFAAGLGINNVNLTRLSNNSKLVNFPDSDHYMPFYQKTALTITTHLMDLVQQIRKDERRVILK